MPTTSRRQITTPADTDEIADGAGAIRTLAGFVDNDVEFQQGVVASRPTSTAGSPGTAGRIYRSTDEKVVDLDLGTSWGPNMGQAAVAAFRASLTTNPNYASGSTVVYQTSDIAPTRGSYSTSTGRFVPAVPGKFRLSAIVTLSDLPSGGWVLAYLLKNGNAIAMGSLGVQPSSLFAVPSVVSTVIDANGTSDYFEVQVTHSSGTTHQTLAANAAQNHFCGEWLGI
jgi:hypothetical protein